MNLRSVQAAVVAGALLFDRAAALVLGIALRHEQLAHRPRNAAAPGGKGAGGERRRRRGRLLVKSGVMRGSSIARAR